MNPPFFNSREHKNAVLTGYQHSGVNKYAGITTPISRRTPPHIVSLKVTGAVNMEYMKPSETKTTCPWKGTASYYTINMCGELNVDAAWYYPAPKEAANSIQGRMAFWRGVVVTD
jgi:hypothetical protein